MNNLDCVACPHRSKPEQAPFWILSWAVVSGGVPAPAELCLHSCTISSHRKKRFLPLWIHHHCAQRELKQHNLLSVSNGRSVGC